LGLKLIHAHAALADAMHRAPKLRTFAGGKFLRDLTYILVRRMKTTD